MEIKIRNGYSDGNTDGLRDGRKNEKRVGNRAEERLSGSASILCVFYFLCFQTNFFMKY